MATESEEPNEVLAAKIAAMGMDLGTLHFELWADLADLHVSWALYRDLYVGSEESVSLLNRTAPKYFHYAQRMFENGIILHLCRLTDPSQTGDKHNQTVQRLPALIEDEELKVEVMAAIAKIEMAAGFARDHRNRRIAHKDLLLARNQHPRPLESATISGIASVLSGLAECLNLVELRYEGSSTYYGPVGGVGGARSLLHYLRRGMDHWDDERRRWGLAP